METIDEKIDENENEILKCNLDANNCIHINKLISSLNYYKSLNIIENKKDSNKFLNYCCNIYNNLLNDFIHLIINHNNINDLKIINKMVPICHFKKCKYSYRHYNRKIFNKNNNNNITCHNKSLINFYIEIMDSLHY